MLLGYGSNNFFVFLLRRSGLCDTHYIAHVKDACAFLGPGAWFHSWQSH